MASSCDPVRAGRTTAGAARVAVLTRRRAGPSGRCGEQPSSGSSTPVTSSRQYSPASRRASATSTSARSASISVEVDVAAAAAGWSVATSPSARSCSGWLACCRGRWGRRRRCGVGTCARLGAARRPYGRARGAGRVATRITKTLRRAARRQDDGARRRRRRPRRRRPRLHDPARPVGLRQEHAAADDRRPRGPDRRATIVHRRRASSTTSRRRQRDVAMVFQSYALYPHKTVQANIEFPLKVRGVPKAGARRGGRIGPPTRSASTELHRPQAGPAQRRAAPARRARAARSCATRPCSAWTSRCPTSTRSCAARRAPSWSTLHRRLESHVHLRHPRPGRGDDDGHARSR